MKNHPSVIAFMPIILLLAGCTDHATTINKTADQIYSRSSFNDPLPPHAFKSDGCSCWPDGDWLECCVTHDLLYWMGGTRQERINADLELKKCVTGTGHPVVGQAMFIGVRVGGVWWLPTPFRWGFGWDYPDPGPPGTSY